MDVDRATATGMLGVLGAVGAAMVVRRLSARKESADPAEPVVVRSWFQTDQSLRPGTDIVHRAAISTVGGSASLDLRRAGAHPRGVRLRSLTVLGKAEIIVPDTWHVRVRTRTVAGIVDQSLPEVLDEPSGRLTITAIVVLGTTTVTARPVLRATSAAERAATRR